MERAILANQVEWISEPFRVPPEPRALYRNAALDAAAQRLRAAIVGGRGMSLLLGEAGIGKTSLLWRLRWELRPRPVVLVSARAETLVADVLRAAGAAIGVDDGIALADAARAIGEKAAALPEDDASAVVLVDDAERLDPEALLDLAQLASVATGGRRLFPIVIAGRHEIEKLLAAPALASIRDDIAETVTMSPLAHDEVGRFIAYQIERAIVADETFEPEAVGLVALHSRGVPRKVNQICAEALTAAALEGRRLVSRAHVERAIRRGAAPGGAELPALRQDDTAAPIVPPAATNPAPPQQLERGESAAAPPERPVRAMVDAAPTRPPAAPAPARHRAPRWRAARRLAASIVLVAAMSGVGYAWRNADLLLLIRASPTVSAIQAIAATVSDRGRAALRWSEVAMARQKDAAADATPAAVPTIETPLVTILPAASPTIPLKPATPTSAETERPPSPAREAMLAAPAPPETEPAAAATAPPTPVPVSAGPSIAARSLVARGDAMLRLGDIAAARLFYQRAAEQGDGPAATAMARTYDPLVLGRLGMRGAPGDAEAALAWYQKADGLGDQTAQTRLLTLLRLRSQR
jgi:general secretion pathway protein A